MSIPPWYRPKRRPLAEAVLTLDLSRATGIGPLIPGLSAAWDMTPVLCMSDPSYCVRVTMDSDGRTLSVTRYRKHIATVYLAPDPKRIGAPLRALCGCGRRCYRLYLWGSYFAGGMSRGTTIGSTDMRDGTTDATSRKVVERRARHGTRRRKKPRDLHDSTRVVRQQARELARRIARMA